MSILGVFRKKRKSKPEKVKDVFPAGNPSDPNIGPERMKFFIQTCTSPAFQEAWWKHWNDLSERERGAWSRQYGQSQAPLQLAQRMRELDQKNLDESLLRKISDRTLGFLQVVDLLMRGATVAVQGAPSIGSVVLGVVRVVIDVAVRYFEYYEKLTDMMEYLTGLLRTLGVYDGINFKEPRLHETLVSMYTNILAFCRYARRAYLNESNDEKPNALEIFVKVQWTPFEKQFGQIRDNLQRQIENLNMVSNAVTLKTVLAIEGDMNKKSSLKARQERRDFLDWISKHDFKILHDETSKKRYKTTGSWLLETDAFKSWIEPTKQNVLWLTGTPGTGKSVLSSVVINHLIQRSKDQYTKDTVIYIYFKGEESDAQHLPTKIISNLVKQLCCALPTLPQSATEFYNDFAMDGRVPSFSDLESLFRNCLSFFGCVFLVLDGLDECEQKHRKTILDFVFDLTSRDEGVKIFVASRREIDIVRMFRRHTYLHVSSCNRLAQEDIAKLVKHRVTTELSHIQPEVQESVIQTLTEKANGMYLWADLQLTDIAQVPEADIRTQLDLLPTGLDDTYVSIFRKMNALPQTTRNLAQLCFLWALNAKVVLTSADLIDAVSLAHKNSPHRMQPYDAEVLTELTFGLLTISGFTLLRVRPIHFSLKEFATNPNAKHPEDLGGFFPDAETANLKMAIMCLQHLMSDAEPQEFLDTCLTYCAKHFDGHIQSLTTIPEELWKLLDCIFSERPEILKWILAWRWPSHAWDYPNIACMGNPKYVDPDVFMRCTRLHEIPSIWSRYKVADRADRGYPNDNIFLATLYNLDDVLEKIISQGASVNRATADRFTALHLAIGMLPQDGDQKSSNAVKTLLDAGADWNYDARHVPSGNPREKYQTPLNATLLYQEYAAVKIIARHESFNLAVYMKTIPAKCADYIRILAAQGADINKRDEYGDTALRIARDDGREDCVQILEGLGALE